MESNNTLDLRHLLKLVRKNLLMLIIWTLGLAAIAVADAKFLIQPKYQAETQILVNNKDAKREQPGQAFNNQQADVQIINTYKEIITNQVILQDATKQLANPNNKYGDGYAYKMSVAKLKSAVNVETQTNSQVFTLTAEATTPQQAKAEANTIASVFKKRVKKIMDVNNVTIVSSATLPKGTSFPNVKLFALAGAVIGFVISFGYVLIKELFDTTVRGHEFMTDELKLVNLGQVSHVRFDRRPKATGRSSRQRV
ncbi:MAG: Wzz/FepE/Etk N-terminal domain-containing protein [Limosilactobacillus sp.]|nr:Wzz/FepE/Etk N-terminal domain-containing protein [Limosilactobacillus sp.]